MSHAVCIPHQLVWAPQILYEAQIPDDPGQSQSGMPYALCGSTPDPGAVPRSRGWGFPGCIQPTSSIFDTPTVWHFGRRHGNGAPYRPTHARKNKLRLHCQSSLQPMKPHTSLNELIHKIPHCLAFCLISDQHR